MAGRNVSLDVVVTVPKSQKIYTAEGYGEYIAIDVTEENALNLQSEAWSVGLGTSDKPSSVDEWLAPIVVPGTVTSKVQLLFFVGTPNDSSALAYYPPAGLRFVHVGVKDRPEIFGAVGDLSLETTGPPEDSGGGGDDPFALDDLGGNRFLASGDGIIDLGNNRFQLPNLTDLGNNRFLYGEAESFSLADLGGNRFQGSGTSITDLGDNRFELPDLDDLGSNRFEYVA